MEETASVRVDLSGWPLMVLTVTKAPSRAVASDVRRMLDSALERRQLFGAILTLEKTGLPGPALIRDQTEWFRNRGQRLQEYCAGIAIVTTSAMMRGIPNAMARMIALPTSIRSFRRFEEAREWCQACLNTRLS